jgi:hypothetical protein
MKAKLKIASALLLMSNLAGAQEQKAPRPLDRQSRYLREVTPAWIRAYRWLPCPSPNRQHDNQCSIQKMVRLAIIP